MKIKTKLLWVFVGVAAVAAAGGSLAISRFTDITTDMIQIKEASMAKVQSLTEMFVELNSIFAVFKEYSHKITEPHIPEGAILKAKLNESFILFEKAIALRKSITVSALRLYEKEELEKEYEELNKISSLENKYRSYKKNILDFIAGYEKEGYSSGPEVNKIILEEKGSALLKEVKVFRREAGEEIVNEATDVIDKATNSKKFLLMVICLCFILVLITGLFIGRTIVSPILKLNNATKNISLGNMDIIKHTARDEIGDLAVSFNKMTLDLVKGRKHVEEHTKELEENIQKLNQTEKQLNEAQNIAKLGSWEWEILNTKLSWSDELYNMYDVDKNSFIPSYESFLSFIHPEDKVYVMSNIQKTFESHEPFSYEHRIITNNNITKWMFALGKVVLNEKGEVIKMYGTGQDITERKNAETELHKSEERYRRIVETSQEGIWMIDENNKTNFVNKRLCEMLGYSASEMMGKEVFYFMNEKGKKIATASMEERENGWSGTHDFKFITKAGPVVWTHLSNSPVLDDAGKYIGGLAMVTDITKRKNDLVLLQDSQATLQLNNHKLEQKNKELEQFAYVASHDLQEPLTTIASFVQVLKQQHLGKMDSKSDKYLRYIVQASDRMRVLIKDLLDYSRIGTNKDLEQVDSAIILHDVIADINKAIKDSHTEIQAEQLPVISGYATELKQLFQNLILNSIKFRKAGVPLKINITAQKKNDYWQFAFTDNGIGIDQQHYERIFIIFQRLHTRSEYQGSGIGLSHCKKIVELHHGRIWVESILNEGSTFYFTIHSPKQKINESQIKFLNAN